MAVGARSRDILQQFLMETIVITIVGGLVGLILGVLGTLAISAMMASHAAFPLPAMVLGFVSSASIGLCAGLLPAKRAAAMQPVESLR